MAVDRKALIREYKRTPRPMGVFRVRNIATGRAIIGASTNLQSLLNRHQAQLRMNAHSDKALQKEWNDSGGAAFTYEILDTLASSDDPAYDPADDLRALEQMWREKLAGL